MPEIVLRWLPMVWVVLTVFQTAQARSTLQRYRGLYGGAIPQAWDFYAPGLIQTFFPGYVFTTRESVSFGLTSNNQGQGDCMFYNPYISALDGSGQANSRELMDWMNEPINRTDKRNRLGSIRRGGLWRTHGNGRWYGTVRRRSPVSRS